MHRHNDVMSFYAKEEVQAIAMAVKSMVNAYRNMRAQLQIRFEELREQQPRDEYMFLEFIASIISVLEQQQTKIIHKITDFQERSRCNPAMQISIDYLNTELRMLCIDIFVFQGILDTAVEQYLTVNGMDALPEILSQFEASPDVDVTVVAKRSFAHALVAFMSTSLANQINPSGMLYILERYNMAGTDGRAGVVLCRKICDATIDAIVCNRVIIHDPITARVINFLMDHNINKTRLMAAMQRQIEEFQLIAFATIYLALRDGQTGLCAFIYKTNFVKDHAHLTHEQRLLTIKKHQQQKKESRTAEAWRLAEVPENYLHLSKYNGKLIAAIHKWAFAHSGFFTHTSMPLQYPTDKTYTGYTRAQIDHACAKLGSRTEMICRQFK